ncbi:exodeoxyribonuclease VII large subunit [Thiopseudomonas alkaliphila]|uniref:exodeoxyribonuclease VII large subunit n=1 Tax=Thiopseudomonas alkaliphila TaxID=1697053 RepID=UPI002576F488|nr:exodeoxyribonuclease VII large subunit [Thiopseudomonas alkaliphila]MDM1708638.1 exodeoxyribonuclease VII large subunit [Thiopseudomonas alkaliphila]
MYSNPFQRLGLERDILSVSQLNQRARHLLEDVFNAVWVSGEISNLAMPASGHVYFTLKDSKAQIRCAFFKQQALPVRHLLKEGAAVRVMAKVSIYEGRGDYQLIVSTLEPAGEGALQLAFEALKKRLFEQGLFANENKQALPRHAKRIGIVTSPTGAVIRDIISVFKRRAPQVELVLVPTAVQGKEATQQIVTALALADQQQFDAIILARGGGSLEDLWCFNEEAVALAIAACQTPIVSAIGHETDISISDFVADVRAPTPSAAAELLAPDTSHLLQHLQQLQQRLSQQIHSYLQRQQLQLNLLRARLRHPSERIQQQQQRMDELEWRLQRAFNQNLSAYKQQLRSLQQRLHMQHPQRLITQQKTQLDTLQQRLTSVIQRQLNQGQQRLNYQMQALHAISPLNTLKRGYSILRDQQQVVSSIEQVQKHRQLTAQVTDGYLELKVLSTHKNTPLL